MLCVDLNLPTPCKRTQLPLSRKTCKNIEDPAFEAGAIDCSPVAREDLNGFDIFWLKRKAVSHLGHFAYLHSLEFDLSFKSSMLTNSSWWHGWPPHCFVTAIMDQGCGAEQMLQPKDWALNTTKRFWHWAGADLSPSKETNTSSKHILLSQERYWLVTGDLHPEMPQSRKVKAVGCSRQQDLQQASASIS